MPIEIRELVIKASITESSSVRDTHHNTDSGADDREEIVADCVEQVMELLKNQMER